MADSTDIFALEAFAAQSDNEDRPHVGRSRAKSGKPSISATKAMAKSKSRSPGFSFLTKQSDEGLAISASLDTPLTQALNLIVEEAVKATGLGHPYRA